nr:reverse transcriptase domain-containing protein [Tanacetum cinerariifolium]
MVQSWQRTVKQKVTQSFERVGEIAFPQLAASNGTEGPLIIEAEMGGHMIHRMYIDDVSSMEILYEHCFNRLRPEIKNQMVPATTSLTGFSCQTIWPLGQLKLLVTIGDATHSTKAWMNFMVVKSMSPYNGIIRRSGLKAIQTVPSTVHGMLKFPVEGGIATIRITILIPTECASVTTSSVIPREERTCPANFTVALHPDFPDQEVVIGDHYPIRDALSCAPAPTQHPGRILATSKFQPPPPMVTPVEKRSSNKFCDFHNDKGHSTDECMQLKKHIEELVRAEKLSHLIKEIKQGRDHNGTEGPLIIEAEMGGHMIHCMYIDGGSSMEILYEHCFNRLRPEIKGQMVPATTSLTGFSGETIWPIGHLRLLVTIGDAAHSTKAWMNFMVVKSLSPYNGIIGRPGLKAIQAVPSTVHGMLKFPEKTRPANFTVALHPDFPDQDVVIGGSLSDTGRTELCSILKKNLDIFAWQPSDMTGVSRSVAEHRLNIRDGYSPVRQKKGVRPLNAPRLYKRSWRMCVDFTDLNKACPQDCYPLSEIDWKMESLCGYPFKRSVSRARNHSRGDKAMFGQNSSDDLVVKSHTEAEIMRDVEETFRTLRKEELVIYLSAAYGAISAVLMTERGAAQTPIYFISRALQGPELNYSPMEKLVISLVFAAKRLRRYFQAHPITVITDQPIKQVLSRPDVAGRLQKWSIMLGEYNVTYRLRTSVKGQILADFIIEIPVEVSQAVSVADTQEEPWTLFTDGSSCVDGSSVGLILTSPQGAEFTYALRFQFTTSNNEAEYEALVAGLRIAARMGVKNVQVSVDSKLVSNQVLGTYAAKEDNMIKYLEIVKGLVSGFTTFSISQVPRSKNKKADAFSKIASTSPFFGRTMKGKKFDSRHGLLHEVDRSKGSGNNYRRTDWCDKLNITQRFASVKHPQSNGLVERVNRSLGEGIKSRLGEGNKNWVEELPHVLWAHRTMIKSSHGDTPFSLTYGTEAVLPTEIGMPTYQRAVICEAKAKSKMMKYYNARVRCVAFKPGEFVYRSNDASHAVAGGKLGPKWEGPYEVIEALGD